MDTDLFGQPRVTWDEVRIWLAAYAPHMLGSDWRTRRYVELYNIPEKIARERKRGTFPPAGAFDL